MSLHSGERQVARLLSEIRKDHLARYYWVSKRLAPVSIVMDIGCGCGYGAHIMACTQHAVFAIDIDPETIEFAKATWPFPIGWICGDASKLQGLMPADAAVCFEVIEHLADPKPLLKNLATTVKILYASVPNEDGFKFTGQQFHHRHYTSKEFTDLLADCGWNVIEWWGQAGIESDVEPLSQMDLVKCRTLVFVAEPA